MEQISPQGDDIPQGSAMAEKPHLLGSIRINSNRWTHNLPLMPNRTRWAEVIGKRQSPQNLVNSQVSSIRYVFKMISDIYVYI